ncbi:MAG TPA: hypothetical protein VGN73_03815 [Gemmatimonadaceae bacterium]|jgi:hypothetical protein|nr:hypothetical protein [Gemmatimonadaceae bacterium]
MTKNLFLTTLSLAAFGCSSVDGSALPPQTHSYIVGVDISGSRTPTELAESKQLLEALINELEVGDRLTLVEMYQGGKLPARQWSDSTRAPRAVGKPGPSELRRLEDFKAVARMQAQILFDTTRAKEIRNTDIFGTLVRAADYSRPSPNTRRTLLLLSDMINETPDVTMTTRSSIPTDAWIRHLSAGRRIPQLRDVCVVVAGADVSSARGAAIRDFWEKYFEAAGTHLNPENYRNMIANASEVGCGG